MIWGHPPKETDSVEKPYRGILLLCNVKGRLNDW